MRKLRVLALSATVAATFAVASASSALAGIHLDWR